MDLFTLFNPDNKSYPKKAVYKFANRPSKIRQYFVCVLLVWSFMKINLIVWSQETDVYLHILCIYSQNVLIFYKDTFTP